MKRLKLLATLMIVSFLLLLPFGRVYAEERNIYVGDLINIKIANQNLTEEELRDKFADFEIVKLKEEADGYLLTIRSFDPGEKTIQIGNDELKITVKSTLKEIDRKEVYEGNLTPKPAGFYVEVKYLLYAVVFLFLLTGAILLIRFIRRRKAVVLTPYQRFLGQIDSVALTMEDCFIQLNFSLKEYLEQCCSCKIKGKTSDEIIQELSRIPNLELNLSALYSWFEKCDYYKFTQAEASMDYKQSILEELKELIPNIESIPNVELRQEVEV